jgi:hypothetical protein
VRSLSNELDLESEGSVCVFILQINAIHDAFLDRRSHRWCLNLSEGAKTGFLLHPDPFTFVQSFHVTSHFHFHLLETKQYPVPKTVFLT